MPRPLLEHDLTACAVIATIRLHKVLSPTDEEVLDRLRVPIASRGCTIFETREGPPMRGTSPKFSRYELSILAPLRASRAEL